MSRWATVATLLISAALAWCFMGMNVLLLVWAGLGGMMAALVGPLVLGALWRGVTPKGAIAGFVLGGVSFILLHSGVFDPGWFAGAGRLGDIANWLSQQAPNPYSCAVIGEIVGVVTTILVSFVTQKLPEAHLDKVFGVGA